MRIVGGAWRRRKIEPPVEGAPTRPIPDRVKEAVFNLLRGHVEGQRVVDAFAGTGAVGLEALSRGAAECAFIEKDKRAAGGLTRNIESLGAGDRARVIAGDALSVATLARCPRQAHLVFFDPPYAFFTRDADRARLLEQFTRYVELLDEEGYAILRTPWPLDGVDLALPGAVGPETHVYGSTAVHLYMRAEAGGGEGGGG